MPYKKIDITVEDLRKTIYFILMKFRSDSLHLQGTSSKGDLIGGFVERWFNKIAETLIFDDLLIDKKYKVVSDFFLYGNDSEKNAPDILGLKTDTNFNIPFVQYDNGTWKSLAEMPRIEVKAVRETQYLLGVREPQMIDDYYVFIESNLEGDYLTAIFEDAIFNDKYFKELEMSSDFIYRDDNTQIVPHLKMSKSQKIGTMELIGTYSKDELRKNMVLCPKKTSPFYFSEAVNVNSVTKANDTGEVLSIESNGRVNYSNPETTDIYLPFSITTPQHTSPIIKIIKKNKGSIYLVSNEELIIHGNNVKPGLIKVGFKKFERSSSWNENIATKYMLKTFGKDSTEELISTFDRIYLSKTN